jgi:putative ABC transport system permease protein
LPFPDPERLVIVSESNTARGISYGACSQRIYRAVRERKDLFRGITAMYRRIANSTIRNESFTVTTRQTNAEFFETFGFRFSLGRGFHPSETAVGKPAAVAILGHRFWRTRFGADENVIGRIILIDDIPSTIIGVMPPTEDWLDTDVIVPLQPIVTEFQARRMLTVIGRLKPGITLSEATQSLQKTAEAVAKEWPATHGDYTVAIQPLFERVVGPTVRRIMLIMSVAVAVVFLIACANLANLLLVRALGRRQDLAIHTALGAGRIRMARRLLVESIMLALLGGCFGVLFALWVLDVFRVFVAGQMPRIETAAVGWQALLFAVAIALLLGLASGLMPALHASGANPNEVLKEAGGGSRGRSERQGFRKVLVIIEVALAFALLTSAGLLGRSVLRASTIDPGLAVDDRIAITVNLPPTRYRNDGSVIMFWKTLLERIESIPGVKNAAATSDRWLLAGRRIVEYDVDGEIGTNNRVPFAELRTVTPGYFRTLEIPVVKGRVFDDRDGPLKASKINKQSPFVVVISKTLAARQWPGEDPIGKRIRPEVGDQEAFWSTVIGVVDDIRQSAITESPVPTVYLPEYQYAWRRLFLLIHTEGDPGSILSAIRNVIESVDPTLPADDIVSLEELRNRSLSRGRSLMYLLMGFAFIALTLAAVGIYALIAHSVTSRIHDFGVRISLGADRRNVMSLVLRQGILLTLAGEALGIALALVLCRLLSSILFEVSAADPVTYGAVAGFILLVTVAACLVPGWRTSRVNPATALRAE